MESKKIELQKRLESILVKYPMSLREMAKHMGINDGCFRSFFQDPNKRTSMKTLYKVEKFINEKESEYRLNSDKQIG